MCITANSSTELTEFDYSSAVVQVFLDMVILPRPVTNTLDQNQTYSLLKLTHHLDCLTIIPRVLGFLGSYATSDPWAMLQMKASNDDVVLAKVVIRDFQHKGLGKDF